MKKLLVSTALAALVGLPAAAQQTLGTDDAVGSQTGTQAGIQDQDQAQAQNQTQQQTQQQTQMAQGQNQGQQMHLRAANLIGMQVYRSDAQVGTGAEGAQGDWEQVGSIRDMILTPQGEVEAVIVDVGGFLGMGAKQIGIDMREIRVVADDATAEDGGDYFLVMNIPREVFDQAEAYDDTGYVYGQQGMGGTTESATMQNDPTQVPQTGDQAQLGNDQALVDQDGQLVEDQETAQTDAQTGAQTGMQTDQTEQQDALAVQDPNAAPDAATGATGLRDDAAVDDTADLTGTQANISPETTRMPVEREGYGVAGEEDLTADRLTGTPVYDATDEWVGEVSDLIIGDGGRVQAVVVDIGGFLGIGEKPVALELNQVDVLRGSAGDDLRIYVSYTEEEMEAMPDYAN